MEKVMRPRHVVIFIAIVLALFVIVDLSWPLPEWRIAASYYFQSPPLTMETAGPPLPIPLWLLTSQAAVLLLLGWTAYSDSQKQEE